MSRDLPDPEVLVPKPCSCGGQAWLKNIRDLERPLFRVFCEKCGKLGGVRQWGPSAVAEWNAKSPPE
jgi:hypothetical protein